MLIDYFAINLNNIYLASILLSLFNISDQKIYLILIIDLIINGTPFVTIILILLYNLNKSIFKYLNNNFLNSFLILILDYFLFGIIIYSIFNKFDYYIINLLLHNFIINIIIYFIGLKIIKNKYN